MHREGVPIHLGQHRVQMHEGPQIGDIQRQNGADLGGLIPKDVPGQDLDGLRRGALGDAHRQQPRAEIQNIAALYAERVLPPVVKGYLPGEIGMVFQNILSVDGLPPACGGIHGVEADTLPDAGEGIPGEVQVGDRVQHEPVTAPGQ